VGFWASHAQMLAALNLPRPRRSRCARPARLTFHSRLSDLIVSRLRPQRKSVAGTNSSSMNRRAGQKNPVESGREAAC
jgi:hypothetical protein